MTTNTTDHNRPTQPVTQEVSNLLTNGRNPNACQNQTDKFVDFDEEKQAEERERAAINSAVRRCAALFEDAIGFPPSRLIMREMGEMLTSLCTEAQLRYGLTEAGYAPRPSWIYCCAVVARCVAEGDTDPERTRSARYAASCSAAFNRAMSAGEEYRAGHQGCWNPTQWRSTRAAIGEDYAPF